MGGGPDPGRPPAVRRLVPRLRDGVPAVPPVPEPAAHRHRAHRRRARRGPHLLLDALPPARPVADLRLRHVASLRLLALGGRGCGGRVAARRDGRRIRPRELRVRVRLIHLEGARTVGAGVGDVAAAAVARAHVARRLPWRIGHRRRGGHRSDRRVPLHLGVCRASRGRPVAARRPDADTAARAAHRRGAGRLARDDPVGDRAALCRPCVRRVLGLPAGLLLVRLVRRPQRARLARDRRDPRSRTLPSRRHDPRRHRARRERGARAPRRGIARTGRVLRREPAPHVRAGDVRTGRRLAAGGTKPLLPAVRARRAARRHLPRRRRHRVARDGRGRGGACPHPARAQASSSRS